MDEAGPPSLFVVAYHGRMNPPYFSILKLDTSEELPHETPELPQETPQQIKNIKVDEKQYLIRCNQEPRSRGRPSIGWLFSPPKSSTEDLYMVPNWGSEEGRAQTVKPLHGYKFNFGTGICEQICAPLSSKSEGRVVNLGGRIYLLGYDSDRVRQRDKQSVFQCYDPDNKSWQCLEPFPDPFVFLHRIVATAVWGNYILFNMNYCYIWAYDVIKNKWYQVSVEDEQCYSFEGEAVVVGDTIYALTRASFDVVLALSIEKKPNDGDLLLKCSSENLFPVTIPINCDEDPVYQKPWRRSRHLVHLGKDNFCIVENCNLFGSKVYQDINLTYVSLKGNDLVVLSHHVHEVKIRPTGQLDGQFDVLLCFALPKGATTALKEGSIFNLEPFPEAVQEDENNASKLAKSIAEQLGDCNSTQGLGSSTFGKNKLKNCGEGFRPKTTCAGHNGGGGVYLPGPSNKVVDWESKFSGFMNDLNKVEESLQNVLKEKKRIEQVRVELVSYLKKEKERLENYLKPGEKDLRKVNEILDFLEQDAEKSDNVLEAEEQALDQPRSEITRCHREG